MSAWENMDWATRILMVCGFIFLVFGYVTIFTQKPPSPIDDMSIGLGLIGIALGFGALKK